MDLPKYFSSSLGNANWAIRCWTVSTGPTRGHWAFIPTSWSLFLTVWSAARLTLPPDWASGCTGCYLCNLSGRIRKEQLSVVITCKTIPLFRGLSCFCLSIVTFICTKEIEIYSQSLVLPCNTVTIEFSLYFLSRFFLLFLKKDRDPSSCSSNRPVSFLNIDCKILAKVLSLLL